MKKNTQLILLSLFEQMEEKPLRMSVDTLRAVVPELSSGGFRSLLHHLKNSELITQQTVLNETTISITHHGREELTSVFPALSQRWDTWRGNWQCLVFNEAPEFDKSFRYLRKLLISEGAIALSRGVYIAPDSFSQAIHIEARERYYAAVFLFGIEQWYVGSIRSFIIESYGIVDQIEAYSGVSKEVDRLIKSIEEQKGLSSKDKKRISLVYDRLHAILVEDAGFSTFYFSEAPNPRIELYRLNRALSR